MSGFIAGMITMGFITGGLFFFRFWWRTGDWLFLAFAVAFWLFALNQTLVALGMVAREEQSWIYLLRLAGFGLLIVAIVIKNLQPADRTSSGDGL